ncbi:hypothetical protein D9M69_646400 [compost metagenome]
MLGAARRTTHEEIAGGHLHSPEVFFPVGHGQRVRVAVDGDAANEVDLEPVVIDGGLELVVAHAESFVGLAKDVDE